jgi:hypothetical protein
MKCVGVVILFFSMLYYYRQHFQFGYSFVEIVSLTVFCH